MKLGIVCGLQSEKAALGQISHPVAVAGADAVRAYAASQRLAAEGAECLVSIGLAGALSDHLKTGDLLLPREVLNTDGDRFVTHPMSEALPRPAAGAPLLGTDELILSAVEKRRLAQAYGASSVDMESHAVAMTARERHLPLYVIRVVADPADQSLPGAVRGAVNADGSVRTFATLRGLLRQPGDLPDLLRLGRQSSIAHQVLRTRGRALLEALARA